MIYYHDTASFLCHPHYPEYQFEIFIFLTHGPTKRTRVFPRTKRIANRSIASTWLDDSLNESHNKEMSPLCVSNHFLSLTISIHADEMVWMPYYGISKAREYNQHENADICIVFLFIRIKLWYFNEKWCRLLFRLFFFLLAWVKHVVIVLNILRTNYTSTTSNQVSTWDVSAVVFSISSLYGSTTKFPCQWQGLQALIFQWCRVLIINGKKSGRDKKNTRNLCLMVFMIVSEHTQTHTHSQTHTHTLQWSDAFIPHCSPEPFIQRPAPIISGFKCNCFGRKNKRTIDWSSIYDILWCINGLKTYHLPSGLSDNVIIYSSQ